mgnify:FL=1|jgi:hypothetical protein
MFARNSFLGHPTERSRSVAFEVHNIITGKVEFTTESLGNAEEHAMFLNENSGWKHRIFKVVKNVTIGNFKGTMDVV